MSTVVAAAAPGDATFEVEIRMVAALSHPGLGSPTPCRDSSPPRAWSGPRGRGPVRPGTASRRASQHSAATPKRSSPRDRGRRFHVKVGEFEVGVDADPGTADSGDLETDLPEVLLALAKAAEAAKRGVVVLIDEVQYLDERDLAALIVALHRVGQKGLPLAAFGAGLPQLAALAGDAKSYAERLFDFPVVGALTPDAAREAIQAPVWREGAAIDESALDLIVDKTQGYPYFLQEWGSQAWDMAPSSPITAADVHRATQSATNRLDSGFFNVRLERLTPRERDYVRAMAEIGPGPHRSGEIAQRLGIDVTAAGPLRSALIKKGMIYSPQHGDTAFTVPMFDDFMRRVVPTWSPGAKPSRQRR